MKKFNTKTKIQSMSQNKILGRKFITVLNIALSIAFVLSVGVKFYYSDKASIAGIHLGDYENQIVAYEQQNEFLENQYLTLTSLSTIKPLALENGYVEANVEYYTAPELAVR